MRDGTHDPATGPSGEKAGPAGGRRVALWLALGGAVGLALGILLTIGVVATYTFVTQTLPATRDSVEVFNELNDLRQQINQLNEERKLQEQQKVEAVRQALSAVAATARPPEKDAAGAAPPDKKPAGAATMPAAEKPRDPFADLDAEIENLERTQKVLNTILDLFSRKSKERPKDR